MSTDSMGGRATHRLLPRHITVEQVRSVHFDHPPFGRRGFDEQQVLGYMHRLADELAGRDAEISRLTGENAQLKHALREWHRQLVGYDAAELIARTQRQIEAQITQAESYSREREEQALQLYDDILAEAHQQAREEANRLQHPDAAGAAARPASDLDPEWLDRQRLYAGALLQALDAMAAQVDATRHAFSFEVGRLDSIVDDPVPMPAPPPADPALASGPPAAPESPPPESPPAAPPAPAPAAPPTSSSDPLESPDPISVGLPVDESSQDYDNM